jgi:hypothetical protein
MALNLAVVWKDLNSARRRKPDEDFKIWVEIRAKSRRCVVRGGLKNGICVSVSRFLALPCLSAALV